MTHLQKRRKPSHLAVAAALVCCLGSAFAFAQETLPPTENGLGPQTYEELWASYDPRAEPLDVEILYEWEEGDVLLKVLRYRIGVFKGQKAMMAAVFGYPKGGAGLPGLVQIHGGGQYADYRAILTNARRGYATISIAWAGRIAAPNYKVNPDGVKLFWDGKTDDPNYRVTTDWGPLDGYHAPCRNPKNGFASVDPEPWTLDTVASPRNNPWYLCTLGARRALTFLEQQPQVDGDMLGVYGHSMGGKLTVMTAGTDDRVKAAASSCGGISNRSIDNDDSLYQRTIADDVYLKHITCPVFFLSPANDFHGRINDLQTAVTEIKTDEYRVTCAPHHNHQDTAEYEVASQLWFDQHLKGTFQCPESPTTELSLKTDDGVPSLLIHPDSSNPFFSVDIFYTQHGQIDSQKDDFKNTKARFWHHVAASENDKGWAGKLPLLSIDRPLWVYANVTYPLDDTVTGAGYYYGTYSTDQFNLSSLMSMISPAQLQAAGVKATAKRSRVIESFNGDWRQEWFSYQPYSWPRRTHKVYDRKWAAPQGSQLSIEVQSDEPNSFVIGLDDYAAEVKLDGGADWQTIILSPADFENASGGSLADWNGIKELRLGDQETLKDKDQRRSIGKPWQGAPPHMRNLSWKSR
ncbi:dienelactone hydrolase family protein [Novipirellula sp. SH528]|uniref:dienelactone hydrolase family protein n=1 Tax=Novipirellula sp. SH528 TaxID=3454466 RepID=UPI003FA0DC68